MERSLSLSQNLYKTTFLNERMPVEARRSQSPIAILYGRIDARCVYTFFTGFGSGLPDALKVLFRDVVFFSIDVFFVLFS